MSGDNEEVQEQAEQSTESLEPVDIAEAFKLARSLDKKPTENNVATQENENAGESIRGTEEYGTPISNDADTSNVDTDGDYRGPATDYQDADFNEQIKALMDNINRQANINTHKWMQEKEYKHISAEDLVERDERTGRIRFVSPDDSEKDRVAYFASRSQAQEYVDVINRQIDEKAKAYAKQQQQELIKQNAPVFELYRFAPKLKTMSELEINLMDDIIKPYEVYNNNGEVVGYNCNLDAAASQAKYQVQQLIKRYGNQIQQQANQGEEKPVSRPQVDAKSHGTSGGSLGSTDDYEDITDLSQAMRRLQKEKRERNGK